jgi:hypothetical protein
MSSTRFFFGRGDDVITEESTKRANQLVIIFAFLSYRSTVKNITIIIGTKCLAMQIKNQ